MGSFAGLEICVEALFTSIAIVALAEIGDKLDSSDHKRGRLGVFSATTVAFFIAEMGDKTQIATVALAAQFSSFYAVVVGTTIGMLLANVPVVLLGERIADKIPAHTVRRIAAGFFAALGL